MPFPSPMHVDSPPHHRLPNTASSVPGVRAWPPVASPSHHHGRARLHQRQSYYDDNSVNAISFGFLATAILVSMFLIMAVFERFLRHPTEHPRLEPRDIEEGGKPSCFASPKMKVYDNGVSVLMPGDEVPSFIAHHAPLPQPPERHHPQLTHQQTSHRLSPTPSLSR